MDDLKFTGQEPDWSKEELLNNLKNPAGNMKADDAEKIQEELQEYNKRKELLAL